MSNFFSSKLLIIFIYVLIPAIRVNTILNLYFKDSKLKGVKCVYILVKQKNYGLYTGFNFP